jgi:drug/metabolite transporter (DMT)-like permease
MKCNSRRDENRPLAFVLLGVLTLIWGYNWVVIKVATAYAPPFTFAALRLLLGGITLFGVLALLRKPLRPAAPWPFFWIGLFQSGGFVALTTWAVVDSGAGKVAILAYTMPLWIAILAWPFLGERLNLVQGAALALATCGIILILDFWNSSGSLFADALALLAGISWVIGTIVIKRLQMRREIDPLEMTAWQLFFGGLAVGIVALLVPGHPTRWTWVYGAALVYNVIVASALGYLLWAFVLRHLPARDAGIGTLANPVVGIIAAWLQLGEVPSPAEAAGMALVLTALAALVQRADARQLGSR